MKNISNWVTKKNVLIGASLVLIIFALATYTDYTCNYGVSGFCGTYWEQIRALAEILIISVPLFVATSIAYFLREEVFRAWMKFTLIWVPLTILLLFMVPDYSQSLLPIEKGGVSFYLSAIFVIVSVVIMVVKSISTKKTR